ncbi:MAG TPA: NADH-quinone oxidoreductase subunit C [bacterium]|nr:NADH-quinone oxidoreductase subunit C [bacterium]HQG46517.1 NADH-quinone oxidoreductase subunit C [bacterium]HQI49742.1 NADH-quinone oxidoreductase subunit C [bacterium]HQJ65866.1 NADH-quinone oxidoreductase subunit C [bacterium]
MTASEMTRHLKTQFGSRIRRAETPVPDMVLLHVDRTDSVEINRFLFHELSGRFVVAVGTDYREGTGGYLVDYVYSLAPHHLFVTLRLSLPEKDLWLEAITGEADIPAANWAEREVQDLLGIPLRNHPDPRRLVLADDWPADLHPLRRDMPLQTYPDKAEGQTPSYATPPAGATVVPIGPFFPVLEEPAQFRLFVEGERVVGGDYRGFYNHRGVEKIADSQLNYNQVPFLAERICGI